MRKGMQIISTVFTVLFIFALTSKANTLEEVHSISPEGENKKTNTRLLESGSKIIQNFAPLKGYDVYLTGIHPLKDNANHQMIAFHYCKQVNEDFMQCLLFDSDDKNANLIGVEYIISEKLFNQLQNQEQKYWHPHNYEILSGELVAPRIPNAIEMQLMKKKMNSYGKTWHVWMTDHDGLPVGPAKLAWSLNHDGEANPNLLKQLEMKLNVETKVIRKQRQGLIEYAKPQSGVNALSKQFDGPIMAIPGVVDKNEIRNQ